MQISGNLLDSKVLIDFAFTRESKNKHAGDFQAFLFREVCPHCNTQLIEIYLNKLFLPPEVPVFFETDKVGIRFLVWRINYLVLHELSYWIGVEEESMPFLEDFLEDFL